MTSATLPEATRSGTVEGRSRHRRSATLPTRLPQILPQSTLIAPIITDLNPTKKIDVLHPPTVPRRTVFLETTDSQHHMHRRCALMRQQKWIREHGEWEKPLYGTPAVKEDYKYRIRETLKTQMEERKRLKMKEWGSAINESIVVSQKDYQDRMEDIAKRKAKYQFLVAYTKANKEMMESRWRARKEEKLLEQKRDSEQLRYNPINWSHTLK